MTNAASNSIKGCTCFRLRRVTRRITQHYDAWLADSGLRVTQYSLLSMLIYCNALSVTALADKLEMDRTTLTRNLRPLEEAGWVSIAADERDARVRTVHISTAGRQVWERARPLWRAAQDSINTLLGESSVAALHGLLDESLEQLRV